MLEITFRKLRGQMKLKRYNASNLSQDAGVSRSHISDIVNDKSMPTIEILCRLARPLECKPEDLYDYKWVMP